jgi:hypothetical protein
MKRLFRSTCEESPGNAGTYNPPTAKIAISPILCLRPRLRFLITGIGRKIMAKSVAILMAALVNHIAYWLMQLACSLVQNALTGMQAKMLENTVHMV